ncbi:hypothetical protein TSEDIMI_40007 [Tenacibaculum sediminilitoris]|uniref:tetratricopeptide repeat protein n=1 Tax=Tenacibaculum sediminilitoris TaxID=1820334 RepID=UPI00389622A7
MKKLILFFCFLNLTIIQSQVLTEPEVLHIQKRINEEELKVSEIISLKIKMANHFLGSDNKRAEKLAIEILDESRKSNINDNLGEAYYILGFINVTGGDKTKGLFYLNESIKAFKRELEVNPMGFKPYATLGRYYAKEGENLKALENYVKAQEYLKLVGGDINLIMWLNCDIADIYIMVGEYNLAHQKLSEAIRFSTSLTAKASAYKLMASIYEEQNDLEKALQLAIKSLEFAQKGNERKINLGIYNFGIARIYFKKKLFNKSSHFFDKSLAYWQEINYLDGIYDAHLFKIKIDLELEGANPKQVVELVQLRDNIEDKLAYSNVIVGSIILQAIINKRLGEIELAEKHLIQSLQMIDKKGVKESTKLSLYQELINLYELKGSEKQEFFLKKYDKLKDSLALVSKKNTTGLLEIELNKKKYLDEISFYQERVDSLKNENLKNYRLLKKVFIISFIVVVILIAMIYFFVRKREEELRELNRKRNVISDVMKLFNSTKKEGEESLSVKNIDNNRVYGMLINEENHLTDFIERLNEKIPNNRLSDTEKKVVFYLRLGYSSKEIANILSISYLTVNNYRYSIRKKLGLKNTSSTAFKNYFNKI